MKVAIVYNRESTNVINLFGVPNKEKIGLKTIQRIVDALKAGGRRVTAFEADKDVIPRLEEFMPRVVKGERPGMVFNLSYGIQGQARYTHVPSILEMMGIPYVASGPLAHSLALDKVVTKMILQQVGLPTPAFAVLDAPSFAMPDLPFPLIVKPKNEAVSFGLQVVHDEQELRAAAEVLFREYGQAVLLEQYVPGREVNVGLLGNSPPEALPPVELGFGEGGPDIYTYEDKTGRSGRQITLTCPAPIGPELTERAQDLARRAFTAIGCYDCARVDMRLDEAGHLYILEINSLPSLGPRGSYVRAAEEVGLDYPALCNRLVEVASARYFGTPSPPQVGQVSDADRGVFDFLTQRRDRIERRLAEWVNRPSRTADPVGLQARAAELARTLGELGLRSVPDLTDERSAWTWETKAGLQRGTLLVVHLDVPVAEDVPRQSFRREPELLHGEGIGSSRAPVVSAEYALRALRHVRRLQQVPVGLLYYLDEGRQARYSQEVIRAAARRAARVLVLRPANVGGKAIAQRRGLRRFRFAVEGRPRRVGQGGRGRPVLTAAWERLEACVQLTSARDKVAVGISEIRSRAFPMRLPHVVEGELLLSYLDTDLADQTEARLRELLGRGGSAWSLALVSDRPPMRERKASLRMAQDVAALAERWELPFATESSLWPSVGGLVPEDTAVLCGFGPVATRLSTPEESVDRIALIQRTLLLAEYLGSTSTKVKRA